MNEFEAVITVGGLSALFLEGLKWLVRLIMKKPDFAFPTWFYVVALPVLNAVMPFLMVLIGVVVADPILSMGWQEVLQYVIRIVLGAVISLVTYQQGIKPLKTYNREQKALKEFN